MQKELHHFTAHTVTVQVPAAGYLSSKQLLENKVTKSTNWAIKKLKKKS